MAPAPPVRRRLPWPLPAASRSHVMTSCTCRRSLARHLRLPHPACHTETNSDSELTRTLDTFLPCKSFASTLSESNSVAATPGRRRNGPIPATGGVAPTSIPASFCVRCPCLRTCSMHTRRLLNIVLKHVYLTEQEAEASYLL
jgi:hypothetical protein